jgi:hypothetical protein
MVGNVSELRKNRIAEPAKISSRDDTYLPSIVAIVPMLA